MDKEKKMMENYGYIDLVDISEFGFPFSYAGLNKEKGVELIGRNLVPIHVFGEWQMRRILSLFLKAFNGESKKVRKIVHHDAHKKVQTRKEEPEESPLNLNIDAITKNGSG